MIRHYKSTLAPLALLLSALILSNAATAQLTPNYVRPRSPNETPAPKVVFIGDQFTYMWGATPPFAANPNWINQGWAWTPVPQLFLDLQCWNFGIYGRSIPIRRGIPAPGDRSHHGRRG